MNTVIPDVKIALDKERSLRFDLNAMVHFEEASGKNLFDGTFKGVGMSAKDIRSMLWACLLHEDSKLTVEQVGALITTSNMAEVATKLGEAFSVATGAVAGAAEGTVEASDIPLEAR